MKQESNQTRQLRPWLRKFLGASVALVQRVFDEYGDPVEKPESSVDAEEQSLKPSKAVKPTSVPTSDQAAPSDLDELTAKQRETLQQINEKPKATQEEIGEALGVTAPTISTRLSDIADFAWQNRQDFVSNLFGKPLVGDGQGQVEEEVTAAVDPRLEQIEDRLVAIESDLDRSPLPTELAHKVIHACMDSEDFSEEEELELIRALFGE